MNSAVAGVLNKVLGDWLEGLDAHSLDLSLLKGAVRLGPIRIRTDAVDQLGFPFLLRHGYVKGISVTIPWAHLTSRPLKIELEGVYVYISPKDRSQWSPEAELRNQHKAKIAQLANFELLNREQLPSDPGFTQRLIRKIISNLQVSINGVYIRYEDDISSTVPFAFGIVVKKLQALTCNAAWMPEFQEEAKVLYKLARIEGLAVFLDSAAGKVHLSNPQNLPEKDLFEAVAAYETDPISLLPHQYLLHPSLLEAKLTLNQDPTNRSIPQAEATISLGAPQQPLKVGFEVPMATHLLKCAALFSDFQVFQAGVLKLNVESVFDPDEGEYYRNLYIKWRNLQETNKKKAAQLVPELESFERNHTYFDIAKQRKIAIQEEEMSQRTTELEAKRQQLSAPVKEGRFSRMTGYVWGSSEDKKTQKEAERLKELQITEEELRTVRENREKFQQEMQDLVRDQSGEFDTSDKAWDRFKLRVNVHGYTFEFAGEERVFMHMEMKKLALEAVLRPAGMTISLEIRDFTLRDEYVKSDFYPNIVESGGFDLHFHQSADSPAELDLASQQLIAVANLESLLAIGKEVVSATAGLVNVVELKQKAGNRSEVYIQAGKRYLEETISGKYTRNPVNLRVNLAAPCLVLPLNLHNLKDILVIDLGNLQANSLLAPAQSPDIDYMTVRDEALLYDRYHFELKDVEICTVWGCSSVREWRKGNRSALYRPQGLNMDVKVNGVPMHPSLPAVTVSVTNDLMPVMISDKQLFVLLAIQEKYLEELAAAFPAQPSRSESEISPILQGQQSTESSECPQTISVISQFLHIYTDKFCVDISLKDQIIFNFTIDRTLMVASLTNAGELVLDLKVEDIFADDMRKGIAWKRMLGDPNILGQGEIAAEEETAALAAIQQIGLRDMHYAACAVLPTNSCDFSMKLSVLKAGKEVKVLARLGDMCVTLNPDTIQALLEVPNEAYRMLADSKPAKLLVSTMNEPIGNLFFKEYTAVAIPVSSIISDRYIEAKLVIDCAELRLPFNSQDPLSKVFCLYAETNLLYKSSESYHYDLNVSRKVLLTTPIRVDTEARMDVYNVGMVLGYEQEGRIRSRNRDKGEIMKPCRLNMSYSQLWTDIEAAHKQGLRTNLELSLETFDLVLGFKDIAFFLALAGKWSILLPSNPAYTSVNTEGCRMPVVKPTYASYPVVLVLDIKSECLLLDLCDDTKGNIVPLTRSQIGNLSAQMVYSDSDFTLSFTGSTETSYYNSLVASWEPLVEFWTFELLASPKPLKPHAEPQAKPDEHNEETYLDFQDAQPLAVQLKSVAPLRVNVTYSMIKTLSVAAGLAQTFGNSAEMWLSQAERSENIGKNQHLKAFYKLKNKTGERISVRIEGPKVPEAGEDFYFDIPSDSEEIITQQTFEEAAGRSVCVKKYASLLQTPQTPSQIAITMPVFGVIGNVSVDKIGLFAYESSSGGKIVVEVTAKSSHITAVIQSAYKVVNNTAEGVIIGTSLQLLEAKEIQIAAGRAISIPAKWSEALDLIYVQSEEGNRQLYAQETCFRLGKERFAVADNVVLQTSNESVPFCISLLNPPITVRNHLPCVLHIALSSSHEVTTSLEPGAEQSLYAYNPQEETAIQCTIDFGPGRGKAQTPFKVLRNPDEHFKLTPLDCALACDKLSFKYLSSAQFNTSPDIDIAFRPSIRENYHSSLLTVYNQYWIINHTAYRLKFTGKRGGLCLESHSLGMVKCKRSALQVSLAESEEWGEASDLSQSFNITTTGVAGLIKLRTKGDSRPNRPVEVSLGLLIVAGTWPILESTIIHIYPRYVLRNAFDFPLFIRQRGLQEVISLPSGSALEYQLQNSLLNRQIELSSDSNCWSSPFSLDEIEDFQVRCLSKATENEGKWWQSSAANGYMTYIRVVISTETEATLFLSFLPPTEAEIVINNESEEEVRVSQLGTDIETVICPRSKVPFAYDNRMEAVRKVAFRTLLAEEVYVLEEIKQTLKPLGDLSVVSYPEISSKVVLIRKNTAEITVKQGKILLQADQNRFSNIDFSLYFPGFELSLHDEVPTERFLLTITVLQGKVKLRTGLAAQEHQRYTQHSVKMSVQHVQLDNMSTSSAEFPVIFGGVDAVAATAHMSLREHTGIVTPFFQFGVIKERIERYTEGAASAFDRFVLISLTVQEMQAKVHQDTVTGLLSLISRLQTGISHQPSSPLRSFSPESICPSLAASSPTLTYAPGAVAAKVYVHMLQLNALKVTVSFKTGRRVESVLGPRQAFGVLRLLGSVGSAFINISDSTLHFSSVIVCDSFQTISGIAYLVVRNYVKQGILQFYKILGSADLIGNPIGLIDKLGTGVFEFFSEPVKGLMQASPKKFAKGLGKGVKSLVSGVLSGSFGSVSKITGSLYTVVREVGGDEASADRINASDNVAEGMYHGVKGGIVDLAEGVTGIFTKPWKGAKEAGVKGFLKGVSSGVIGAAVAPLSAVLRVSTSVTQSVVAQTEMMDDKVKQRGKMRYARQFGARKVMETYNHELAQAQHILQGNSDFQGEELVFYMRTKAREKVILTENHLFYVEKFEVMFVCSLENISKVSVRRGKKGFLLVLMQGGLVQTIGSKSFQRLAKLYHALEGMKRLMDVSSRLI